MRRRLCLIPRAVLERELAKPGSTYRALAISYGFSDTAVATRARAFGLVSEGIARRPPTFPNEKLAADIARGFSLSAIAQREGVTRQSVHQRCRKLGLPTTVDGIAAYAAAQRALRIAA